MVFSAYSASAQGWQDITSQIPGGISDVENGGPLATDGTTLYVNAGDKVVWSSDNGGSFTAAADIVGSTWRWVKFVNGELWVGGEINSNTNSMLWRSSDKGATWTPSSSGMPGGVGLGVTDDIAYDADANVYWAASRFGGAYRSMDGTNWDHVRVGLPQTPYVGFSVGEFVHAEGGDALVSMIGPGFVIAGGVYRTQNNGLSWKRLSGMPHGDTGNFVKIGNRILVSTSGTSTLDRGLYYTEDFGDTWTFQNQWLRDQYLMFSNDSTVFAAGNFGIWYSANQGDSWDRFDSTGLPVGVKPVDIVKVGSFVYLFGGNGKLYRMSLAGVSLEASTQIVLDPAGVILLEEDSLALTGKAVGTGAVTYQWNLNGVAISGATSSTYSVSSVAASDAGLYALVATANGQSVESKGANVIVKARVIGEIDPQFEISAFINSDVLASTIDNDGNVWYTGSFKTNNSTLIKVHPVTGEILARAMTVAQGRSLAMDTNGKIWAGTNNAWLHRVSTDGAIDFTVDIMMGAGSGRVNAIVPHGNAGKMLIAGLFNKVGTVDTGPVALLNNDGTVDTSFDIVAGGLTSTEILDIDVGPNGEIYITKAVFSVFPSKTQAVAKIKSDGTLDTDWWAGGQWPSQSKSNIQGDVRGLAVLADGSLLVALRNAFGSNSAVITNANKSNLMKLNPDGSRDLSFNKGGAGPVGVGSAGIDVVVAPDGKLILFGDFGGYNSVEPRSFNDNITRLLADGTPDPYWNVGEEGWGGSVGAASVSSNGSVYGGSGHTRYNGANQSRILKLVGDLSAIAFLSEPRDLTLDLGETATFSATTFGTTAVSYQWRKDGVAIPGATSATLELASIDDDDDGDYDVVITNQSGQLASRAARLLALSVPKFLVQPLAFNGNSGDEIVLSVDAIGLGSLTYQWYFEGEAISGATGSSLTIEYASVLDSGSYNVEVTGSSGTRTSDSVGVSVESVAGALDASFSMSLALSARVNSLVEMDDGGLVIVGTFTTVNGTAKSYLGKVDSLGKLDEAWPVAPSANTWINTIVKQADGKFIVGGQFSTPGGWSSALQRLHSDGSFDGTFGPGSGFSLNSIVHQLEILSDGKILVLCDPKPFGIASTYDGEAVAEIIRLNADGSLDETYLQPDFDTLPEGFKVLRNGKVVVYGNFNTVNGDSQKFISQLNADGSVDELFALGNAPDGRITSVDQGSNGKIIVGGWFSNLGGFERKFVALLNENGAVDEVFDTSSTGGSAPIGIIQAVSALLNGEYLVVGNFTSWGSPPVGNSYRIATVDAAGRRTGFTLDTSGTGFAGFSSNPTSARIFSGLGYAYVSGTAGRYQGQVLGGLPRIHLESMDLVFLTQPEKQFVGAGETATFTAEALGTTVIGYQWYKDGSLVPGATSPTLEVANAQESNAGLYTLEAVNASGSILTSPAKLLILGAPEILNDPVSKFVQAGDRATLRVEAIGVSPLNVQWYRNGQAVAGATAQQLVLDGALASDAGMYHAVLTNTLGTATSGKAALNVEYGQAGLEGGFGFNYFGVTFNLLARMNTGDYRVGGSFTNIGGGGRDWAGIGGLGRPISGLSTPIVFSSSIQYGDFNDEGVLTAFAGNFLKRVKTNGKEDIAFVSALGWSFLTAPVVKVLPDGSVLVSDKDKLARLLADGSVDTAFNNGGAGPVGTIASISVNESGKILIAGSIASYNGATVAGVALLKSDGTIDSALTLGSGFDGAVNFAEFGASSKIYVGGAFADYAGNAVNQLVRMGMDGTYDSAFVAPALKQGGVVGSAAGLLKLADGTLLVRGDFTVVDELNQGYIMQLDTSGNKMDGMLFSAINGPIHDWVAEPDGGVAVVGAFTSPKKALMRFNPVPPPVTIVTQPEAFQVDSGENGRMEIAVTGLSFGSAKFQFQWQKDGVDIPGATHSYLDFEPATLADRGSYTVTVTNHIGDPVASNAVVPTIEGTDPTPFDLWAIAQGVPSELRGENDDADGDGIVNGVEYALGLDPNDPDWENAPQADFVRGSELGLSDNDLYLVMTVRLKRGLAGVSVTPRAATSVVELANGKTNIVTISGPTADGDFDVYKYRSSFGVSDASSSVFMDIEVKIFMP